MTHRKSRTGNSWERRRPRRQMPPGRRRSRETPVPSHSLTRTSNCTRCTPHAALQAQSRAFPPGPIRLLGCPTGEGGHACRTTGFYLGSPRDSPDFPEAGPHLDSSRRVRPCVAAPTRLIRSTRYAGRPGICGSLRLPRRFQPYHASGDPLTPEPQLGDAGSMQPPPAAADSRMAEITFCRCERTGQAKITQLRRSASLASHQRRNRP
jgi:hypothetical protein